MHVQKETRADEFLDDYVEPMGKKVLCKPMMESAELSELISQLNQVSQQSKMIPVNEKHLVVLAKGMMSMLEKILSEIDQMKKSQQQHPSY